MAGELVVRGGGALKKMAAKSALKKAAKKGALKKAAAKKSVFRKAPGKKAPGKKGAKQGSEHGLSRMGGQSRAFHHLQRATALVSLLEKESGDDLRMLHREGVAAYRRGAWAEAGGLLQAAEHLGMAGLYAARASHRAKVEEPAPDEVYRQLDGLVVRLDSPDQSAGRGTGGRLHAMAKELLNRAEATTDHDLHLAWELVGAAEGICLGLDGTRG